MGLFEEIRNMEKREVTEVTEVTAVKSLDNNSNSTLYGKVTEVTETGTASRVLKCEICAGSGICKEVRNDCGACEQIEREPEWDQLLMSKLGDMDVVCVEVAIFLFAVRLIESCAQHEFEAMCRRYVPGWRCSMVPEAWKVCAAEIRRRLDRGKGEGVNG